VVLEYGLYFTSHRLPASTPRYLAEERYSVVSCSATVYAHLIDAAHNNQAGAAIEVLPVLGTPFDVTCPTARGSARRRPRCSTGVGWRVTALLVSSHVATCTELKLRASWLMQYRAPWNVQRRSQNDPFRLQRTGRGAGNLT